MLNIQYSMSACVFCKYGMLKVFHEYSMWNLYSKYSMLTAFHEYGMLNSYSKYGMMNTFHKYSMFNLNCMLKCAISMFNTHTQHDGHLQLVTEHAVPTWPCRRSKGFTFEQKQTGI